MLMQKIEQCIYIYQQRMILREILIKSALDVGFFKFCLQKFRIFNVESL